MTNPYQLEDLLAFPPGVSRERATWVYGALRFFLDMPASVRTERLLQFTADIDAHPRRRTTALMLTNQDQVNSC